jgi:hypothetical protein
METRTRFHVDNKGGSLRIIRTTEQSDHIRHADICIPFEITDDNGTVHYFEAVGFRETGEEEVSVDEALGRAGDQSIQDEEDYCLIHHKSYMLPKELKTFKILLTALPHPTIPDHVRTLFNEGGGVWLGDRSPRHHSCCGLSEWRGKTLVLRRRAESVKEISMDMKLLVIRNKGEPHFVVWEESDLDAGDVYDGEQIVESVIDLSSTDLHPAEIDQFHALMSFDDVQRLLLHALDSAYLQGRRDQRTETQHVLRSLIEG